MGLTNKHKGSFCLHKDIWTIFFYLTGGKSTQKKAVNAINKGKGPEIKNGSNRLKFPKNINYEVDVEGEILVVEAEQLSRPHSMKAVSNGFKEKAFEFTVNTLFLYNIV